MRPQRRWESPPRMASSLTAIAPTSRLQPLGPLASFSAVRFRSRPETPQAPGTESDQRALKNLASRLAKLRVSLERLSTSSIVGQTLRRRLVEVGGELDALFSDKFNGISDEVVADLRDQLRDSISAAFESILGDTERSKLRSGFGIAFSFSDTAQGIFDFDLRKFNRSVSEKFNDLTDFLFRDEVNLQAGGLIPSLIGTLKDLEADIADTFGSASTGLLVDVMA